MRRCRRILISNRNVLKAIQYAARIAFLPPWVCQINSRDNLFCIGRENENTQNSSDTPFGNEQNFMIPPVYRCINHLSAFRHFQQLTMHAFCQSFSCSNILSKLKRTKLSSLPHIALDYPPL